MMTYTDSERRSIPRPHRTSWWLVASYLCLIAGFIILTAKTADAQEREPLEPSGCETYVYDEPGFWAWTSFRYIELLYADGTVGRFIDVAEGDYLSHPNGVRVVQLTKCTGLLTGPVPTPTPIAPVPTPTATVVPLPRPTPTPEEPSSTPTPLPTATPTAEPSPQPTTPPSPTPPDETPEPTPSPTVAPTPTPNDEPTPSPTPSTPPETPTSTPTPTAPPTSEPTPTPAQPSPTPPLTELPETGADLGLVWLGLMMLTAGSATAVIARSIRRMDGQG